MENRDAIDSSENEAVNLQQGKGGGPFSADVKEEVSRGNQTAPPGGAPGGTSVPEEGAGGEEREGWRGASLEGTGGSLAGGVGGRQVAGRVRQPFSEMNQLESDMALARAIQEQERAFVLFRSASFRSDFGGTAGVYDEGRDSDEDGDGDSENETGDARYEEEEDRDHDDGHSEEEVGEEDHGYYEGEGGENPRGRAEGVAVEEVDGSQFESDEAFARALQEAEDRATTARLMALAAHVGHGTESDYNSDREGPQDEWDDDHEHAAFEDLMLGEGGGVDPDQMSYEELMALSEAVGSESRGLKDADIVALPTSIFVAGDRRLSSSGVEQCVVCRVEFEEGDNLITLPCDHYYHQPCISQWLSINKACPMCGGETKAPTSSLPEGGHSGH